MRRQLQSLGLAGVLAYGMLNTLYYTTAFLSIWVWVLGAPRGEPALRISRHSKSPSPHATTAQCTAPVDLFMQLFTRLRL